MNTKIIIASIIVAIVLAALSFVANLYARPVSPSPCHFRLRTAGWVFYQFLGLYSRGFDS